MHKLHKWQAECLNIWANNNCRGIVNAITGSGKTMLALHAISYLEMSQERQLRVKIVVPQTFLASQWKEEIVRNLSAKPSEIGFFSGKRKNLGRKYTIYVINSARYSLARHILAELSQDRAVLLIADECHHYGSSENSRIFDFFPALKGNSPYFSLGLSATPEIVNFNTITRPLGREIYSYDLGRALKDRVISKFFLFSINLEFTKYEQSEYTQYSDELRKCMLTLKNIYPELTGMPSALFFSHLNRLSNQDSDNSQLAARALTLIYKRRTLSHMASNRSPCAVSIVNALPPSTRIILFCERIEAASTLHDELQTHYPNQIGLYHSKMPENTRRDMLGNYKHGVFRLLICCKALDEGLNIPHTDAGIIVSSSLSSRQRIQRLGRILRYSKEIKRIYYMYIKQSSEDYELARGISEFEYNIPIIKLDYLSDTFISSEYEKLREKVIDYTINLRSDSALIDAIDRNLDIALLRGDFLLQETVCTERIQSSTTTNERNYWVCVLYIIFARLGKLG